MLYFYRTIDYTYIRRLVNNFLQTEDIKMTKLTILETEVMNAIVENNFYENGFNSVLWSDVLVEESGMDAKKMRGSMASMSKKGLLVIAGTKEDKTVSLTEEGIEALKSIRTDLDAEGYKVTAKPVEVKKEKKAKKTLVVQMSTFTGMDLGMYQVQSENETEFVVNLKNGQAIFSKATLKQTNGKNPKFANKITLV